MKEFTVISHQVPQWVFAWRSIATITDSLGKNWLAFNEPYKDGQFFETQHECEDYVMAKAFLCLPLSRRINGKEPQFEL